MNGITKNSHYLNYEVLNSDICFACELHHESKQQLDDYMYISHKKVSSKLSERSEKYGRGKNGMGFFYNSDIVLTSPIQYYGNRIGLMELDSVAIIGVYMVYNDNKAESYEELLSDLQLIEELQLSLVKSKEVIMVGDFNIDLSRRNRFSMALVNLLQTLDYIIADIEYGRQKVDYTWHSIRYDEDEIPYIISSWVDHVLVPRKSNLIEYIEIIASGSNEGDHNSIRLIINSPIQIVNTIIVKKRQFKPNLNWNRQPVVDEYCEKADACLAKLDTTFAKLKYINPNSVEVEKLMTDAHHLLNDALVCAKSRIVNLYAYTKRPKKKYGLKSKDWWCSTLQQYMEQMKAAYYEYKQSSYHPDLKVAYTDARKLLRCRKRFNIRLKRDENWINYFSWIVTRFGKRSNLLKDHRSKLI